MEAIEQPELVTIFGGSGFLGRHVVQLLAQRGYRIRVAARRPQLTMHLNPLGQVGQIVAVQANLRDRASIERAVEGSDHVVNCVGILFEGGSNTFAAIQEEGAKTVAEAARKHGSTLTHVSAIGADPESESVYAQTKGRAERSIMEEGPETVIVRPSILFGPEDNFFNKFANMARFSPFIPLIGGGKTRLQPVFAPDVAEVIARHVDGKIAPGIWELGGPEVLTFRECMEEMLSVIQRRRAMVNVPWGMATSLGSFFSKLPVEPPLTDDQVKLLKNDNVVSEEARREGRTFEALSIKPVSLAAVLPEYLVRFRVAGQFSRWTRST
ncbi:complex I NDUFA9 subunit family protein [Pararhizobium mangrovi]|uniref:Complex I NDUFA9 subunit family protein n=1 Tax=Pararhizobium mangrovi TaxID=2590452 RepID=A0A506U6Y4_9HYPH|nr:complex I NDUFA9 subunit family protein [Pararhizobium mangrovi]TPW28379.1 complex I NDUFA9 subunit family protein [Pararhizobium mangrovi]